MSKLSIAVCDENQSYGECISTWFSIEQGKNFSGSFFTSRKGFKEQYNKEKFQIVLLGKAFLEEAWIQAEIEREKGVLWIYLCENQEQVRAESIPAVEKYQPVSQLIRSIFRYYEGYQRDDIKIIGEKGKVWGWFSPEQSIWQTPLAVTMASLLAETEKVLYVSFKECSGFEKWFQEEHEQDLLDVMYFCQNAKEKNRVEMGRFTYSMENMDYIPPVRDGHLLCELQEEDYADLIEMLKQKSSYDIIILEMGAMFPGFFKVWESCSRIYIPQEQNVLAKGINASFEDMVKRQGDLKLEEKISWLSLPNWSKEMLMPGCLMQQWIWGETGDYIKEILGGRSGRA